MEWEPSLTEQTPYAKFTYITNKTKTCTNTSSNNQQHITNAPKAYT